MLRVAQVRQVLAQDLFSRLKEALDEHDFGRVAGLAALGSDLLARPCLDLLR